MLVPEQVVAWAFPARVRVKTRQMEWPSEAWELWAGRKRTMAFEYKGSSDKGSSTTLQVSLLPSFSPASTSLAAPHLLLNSPPISSSLYSTHNSKCLPLAPRRVGDQVKLDLPHKMIVVLGRLLGIAKTRQTEGSQ